MMTLLGQGVFWSQSFCSWLHMYIDHDKITLNNGIQTQYCKE